MPIIESLWLQEACEARTEGPTGTDGINVTRVGDKIFHR